MSLLAFCQFFLAFKLVVKSPHMPSLSVSTNCPWPAAPYRCTSRRACCLTTTRTCAMHAQAPCCLSSGPCLASRASPSMKYGLFLFLLLLLAPAFVTLHVVRWDTFKCISLSVLQTKVADATLLGGRMHVQIRGHIYASVLGFADAVIYNDSKVKHGYE